MNTRKKVALDLAHKISFAINNRPDKKGTADVIREGNKYYLILAKNTNIETKTLINEDSVRDLGLIWGHMPESNNEDY
jgi:hypothetical protein